MKNFRHHFAFLSFAALALACARPCLRADEPVDWKAGLDASGQGEFSLDEKKRIFEQLKKTDDFRSLPEIWQKLVAENVENFSRDGAERYVFFRSSALEIGCGGVGKSGGITRFFARPSNAEHLLGWINPPKKKRKQTEFVAVPAAMLKALGDEERHYTAKLLEVVNENLDYFANTPFPNFEKQTSCWGKVALPLGLTLPSALIFNEDALDVFAGGDEVKFEIQKRLGVPLWEPEKVVRRGRRLGSSGYSPQFGWYFPLSAGSFCGYSPYERWRDLPYDFLYDSTPGALEAFKKSLEAEADRHTKDAPVQEVLKHIVARAEKPLEILIRNSGEVADGFRNGQRFSGTLMKPVPADAPVDWKAGLDTSGQGEGSLDEKKRIFEQLKKTDDFRSLPEIWQKLVAENVENFRVFRGDGNESYTFFHSRALIVRGEILAGRTHFFARPSNAEHLLGWINPPKKKAKPQAFVAVPAAALKALGDEERHYAAKLLEVVNENLDYFANTPFPKFDKRMNYWGKVAISLGLVNPKNFFFSEKNALAVFAGGDEVKFEIQKRLGAPLWEPEKVVRRGVHLGDGGTNPEYGWHFFLHGSYPCCGYSPYERWHDLPHAYLYDSTPASLAEFKKKLEEEANRHTAGSPVQEVVKHIAARAEKPLEILIRNGEDVANKSRGGQKFSGTLMKPKPVLERQSTERYEEESGSSRKRSRRKR